MFIVTVSVILGLNRQLFIVKENEVPGGGGGGGGGLLTAPLPICATFEIPREISEPVTSGTGSPCYKEMAMVQKSSFQSCLNICGDFPKSRY